MLTTARTTLLLSLADLGTGVWLLSERTEPNAIAPIETTLLPADTVKRVADPGSGIVHEISGGRDSLPVFNDTLRSGRDPIELERILRIVRESGALKSPGVAGGFGGGGFGSRGTTNGAGAWAGMGASGFGPQSKSGQLPRGGFGGGTSVGGPTRGDSRSGR